MNEEMKNKTVEPTDKEEAAMSEENKNKAVELSDEQIEKVAGAGGGYLTKTEANKILEEDANSGCDCWA